ncbi:MAG: hypothetical protein JW999_06555, partial [Methanotrichaceae archaeon]|nr:hypothetical protein [Methanotrichaceae archaeon]
LLENGLAIENKKKKKRRKPWIRYERKHSLPAVHLDWHTSRINGKEVCVVLDDSSRFILAGGEFPAAIVLSMHFWQKMKSNIFWPESGIPRPMDKSKNGIIPTRKVENCSMILINS